MRLYRAVALGCRLWSLPSRLLQSSAISIFYQTYFLPLTETAATGLYNCSCFWMFLPALIYQSVPAWAYAYVSVCARVSILVCGAYKLSTLHIYEECVEAFRYFPFIILSSCVCHQEKYFHDRFSINSVPSLVEERWTFYQNASEIVRRFFSTILNSQTKDRIWKLFITYWVQ